MKLKLQVEKRGDTLFEDTYSIVDAESFASACTDMFNRLREQRMAAAPNVGQVFEEINEYALDELVDARISLTKV